MFARRVVYPVSAGDRPIENMFQPLPGAAGGDWRRGHKRLQDLEDVGGGDFGDLPATERSGGMVKAGNPLRGVFVVAPSGTAQLYNPIGSFPERGYAAHPPNVCLSRPLVIQNVPTQVFKGDVRLSGESRNLRHPQPQRPLEGPGGNQTSPKNHPNQTNHSSRPSAPWRRPVTTPPPPPVFPAKAGTHAPSAPSVYPIPTSRRRRHAPHPSFRRKPEST